MTGSSGDTDIQIFVYEHTMPRFAQKVELAIIIEWGWVGYEEFCRSRRVLSTEAEGGGG